MDSKFPFTAPNSSWAAVKAFPDLPTVAATNLLELPGTDIFFMTGKHGELFTFQNDPESSSLITILDIKDSIMSRGDAGLLGIAFHPKFSDEGSTHYHELFLFYTYSPDIEESIPHPLYERVSKFKVSEDLKSIDPESEEIILQQFDRHRWHNGGANVLW